MWLVLLMTNLHPYLDIAALVACCMWWICRLCGAMHAMAPMRLALSVRVVLAARKVAAMCPALMRLAMDDYRLMARHLNHACVASYVIFSDALGVPSVHMSPMSVC